MNLKRLFPALLLTVSSASAQPSTDGWLDSLIRSGASAFLKQVLDQPDSFRYQVIYTRIDRDRHNRPHFHSYYLHMDRNLYFNPASTVKLPAALVALEKLHALHRRGIDRDTPMVTDSSYSGQTAVAEDTSARDGLPSVGQYIRRVFLVSDNEAYNRLYEFDGQAYLNRSLWRKGYRDVRITRRFVVMDEDQNRHTNAIRLVKDGRVAYYQPPAYNTDSFDFSQPVLIGRAHYDWKDSLHAGPMDFTRHNNLPVEDLARMVRSVMFPASVPRKDRFRLDAKDRRFLLQYMSELPRESRYPKYDTSEYFDSYTKFFFFRAGRSEIPSYIRSFNKAGWSYGFLTDAAYLVDFRNRVEFLVTGTIYVNSDGILNDDRYDYEQIGFPFFREIGQILYRYECSRIRKYLPDLSEFKLDYSTE